MIPRLITKPEQSGKTFVMLKEMIKLLECEKPFDIKNINIVLCDNNLMLVLQTLNRFGNNNLLKNHIELSSSKRASTHNYQEVVYKIINNNIRNILCCSNYVRLNDLVSIIETIYKLGVYSFYQFHIWIDEADKWLNGIDKYIIPVIEKYGNIKLNLITATPKKIIQNYGEVEILPLQNSTLPEYHSWLDGEFKIYPDMYSTTNFVEYILTNNSKEIKPGTKWFIPSNIKKETHLLVKEYCKKKGFATIIINGEGIKVYLPNGSIIKRDRYEMPDRLISRIYQELDLEKYPLAITGYLCISRGITISSPNFQITHAIMPAGMKNHQEISQIAGRIKGNQKLWNSYKKPKIYVTNKLFLIASTIESKTKFLSENAFLTGKIFINIDDYICADKPFIYYQHKKKFKTYKESIYYLKTQEHNLKPNDSQKTIINVEKLLTKKCIERRGNFNNTHWVSRILNTKKTIQNGEAQFYTQFILDKMPIYKTIAEPNNTKYKSYVIIPIYKTYTSQPEDVLFVVRHTKWK